MPIWVSYSDADFAQQLHRHSISGYVSFVGIGAVSWSSKKQTLVTVSSTEAEYVGYAGASKDIIWAPEFSQGTLGSQSISHHSYDSIRR